MISGEFACELVARFSGKQGYPKTAEGQRELVRAFQQASKDKRHAELIAEELQIETHFCPEPSEVWRLARATHQPLENNCQRCTGTGWLYVEKNAKNPVTGLRQRYGCVEVCPCRLRDRPVTASLATDEDLCL